MNPREGSYLGLSTGGFHQLAYTEWGAPGAERTVVCVHGLTRNGRDFEGCGIPVIDPFEVSS
jgi:pimeloyl-ACP methyl ester carboxylesterase